MLIIQYHSVVTMFKELDMETHLPLLLPHHIKHTNTSSAVKHHPLFPLPNYTSLSLWSGLSLFLWIAALSCCCCCCLSKRAENTYQRLHLLIVAAACHDPPLRDNTSRGLGREKQAPERSQSRGENIFHQGCWVWRISGKPHLQYPTKKQVEIKVAFFFLTKQWKNP